MHLDRSLAVDIFSVSVGDFALKSPMINLNFLTSTPEFDPAFALISCLCGFPAAAIVSGPDFGLI